MNSVRSSMSYLGREVNRADLASLLKRRRPSRVRPGVEALESRTLLTVVFPPVFGVETEKSDDSDGKMSQPAINILFWGSFWQGTNSSDAHSWNSNNSSNAQAVIDTTVKLIQSSFLNIVTQYGGDPSNMFVNDTAWDPSDPGQSFDTGLIDDRVNNAIDNGFFPEPDADSFNGHPPIYIVVTPPGINSSDATAGGFNQDGSDFDFPADFDTIPEIWTGNLAKPDGSVNLDNYSKTVSHEIGEIMTDEGGDGYEVNTPPAWAAGDLGGDDQIGDKEGNSYDYRMNDGVIVQPLWSKDDNAWVVDDGNSQKFQVDANWNVTNPAKPRLMGKPYSLTVNGDQLASPDDQVLISTAASGAVSVTLNGETVNFDAGKLRSIELNLKTGNNSVSFNNALPSGVTLDMNASGGSINLHGPAAANSWTLTGPDRGFFTSGNPATSTQETFTDVSSITGGPLADAFHFNFAFNDVVGGSVSGNIDGGGAASGFFDTLDFSNFNTQLNVNLQTGQATPIGGKFTNITTIIGNNGLAPNSLQGPDADSLWSLQSPTFESVGNINFSSFGNLIGGSGNDRFRFFLGSTITGNVDGGGGINTLDYSFEPFPVIVNFQTHKATSINGTFSNIQNVVGSQSGSDTIIGPDASWIIDGTNSGSVNGITFSSFENLVGSPQTDTFTFKSGGFVFGNLDGGGGTDTLDYSQLTTPVTINFASHTATGIGGTFSNITAFTAPPAGINIVGPDTPTTWTITGINTVSALGFTFPNTSSVTGGSADDTFVFQNGGRLDGKIDGGGGNNLLTYAGNAGDVVVNLALNLATRVGQGVFNVENVVGGNGNNLLVGDDKANTLTGGLGRNILIGRAGADVLKGGGGDNILIGDSTIYDTNMTALAAIFAEWNRTDISFEKRVSDLISASSKGLNGIFNLDKKSIISDVAVDALFGTSGLDWFFVTKKQDVNSGGSTAGDHTTEV